MLLVAVACGETVADDPAEVLNAAGVAMTSVDTVHFRLVIENGDIELIADITAAEIEGDVARPDRVQAELQGEFRGLGVSFEFRSIGHEQWVKNPLPPGAWIPLEGVALGPAILDPQAGVVEVLEAMRGLELVGTEEVDGLVAHHITGSADNADVAPFFAAQPVEGSTSVDLFVEVDGRFVRRVVLHGPTIVGDAPDIVRHLEFSRFNEPVSIEPPA